MKILISSKNSNYTAGSVGGAETSMRLLAEKLAERGHKVTYFARGTSLIRKKKLLVNGVWVILHPYIRFKKKYSLPPFLTRILTGIISRINHKRMNDIAHAELDLHEVDIVYTYYELPVLKFFFQLKKEPAISYKMVMRMAGLYWYEDIRKNKSKKQIYEKFFNSVDSVNFISEGIKKLTETNSEDLGMKLHFNHQFVCDIGAESVENKIYDIQKNYGRLFKILCAGRFSMKAKRQDILVEAVRLMKNKNRISVKIIGEGENKQNIQKLVENYKLDDVISLYPFMAHEQLQEEMKKSNLLCHPCDYEGLGKIIVESMRMGLPVLGSDVIPLNLYIKNGDTGYLAKNDPAAWAEKLDYIIENSSELPAVSEKAKACANQRFNPETNVIYYEEVFSRLISRSK